MEILDPKTIVIVVLIFARLKHIFYDSPFIGIFLNLPGTFLHELCHYLFAFFLNGKPSNFSLLPEKNPKGGWELGSVTFANPTWYNASFVALAPLALLLVAYQADYLYSHLNFTKTIWTDLGYVFVLVLLIENAIPSAQDFKVAFSKPFGVLVIVVAAIIYFAPKEFLHAYF